MKRIALSLIAATVLLLNQTGLAMRPSSEQSFAGIPSPSLELPPAAPPESLMVDATITAVTNESVSLDGIALGFGQNPPTIVAAYGQGNLRPADLRIGLRVKAQVSAHPIQRKIFSLWILP